MSYYHDGGGGGVGVDQLLQLVLVRAPVVVDSGDGGAVVVAAVVVVAGHLDAVVRGAALLLHEARVAVPHPLHVGDHEGAVAPDHGLAVVAAVHEVLLGQVVLQVAASLHNTTCNNCGKLRCGCEGV